MKREFLRVLEVLAIGSLFALAGYLGSGCDEGAGGEVIDARAADAGRPDAGVLVDAVRADALSPGLGRTDAGFVYCQVPSPTGDRDPTLYGPPHFLVATGDVRAACEAMKVDGCWNPIIGAMEPCPDLAGADCSDVAHDFQGTTGVPWCVGATAMDGRSACGGSPTGDPTCLVAWIAKMTTTIIKNVGVRYNRTWGICSPSGVFLGWICTTV